MAHELTRIRSRLLNTPFLVEAKTFEGVMEYLDKRVQGGVTVQPNLDKDSSEREFQGLGTIAYPEQSLGLIRIEGPLTNKTTGWEALCGGVSYESIKEDFHTLLDKGVKTVGFVVDSGGGEAYGLFDTGNYLRKIADENDVKIISYVDGLSASAAYGLTAISDEVIVNYYSEVGSIGVLVRLINDSKRLEKDGFERTFITAGDEKIPFNEEGGWREEFIEDLQYKVDSLYREFTEYVSKHRNVSVESVRQTQAKTFMAKEAIALGLADRVMTLEEFYSYLSSKARDNKNGSSMNIDRYIKFNKEDVKTMELSDIQSELAQKVEQLEEANASVAQLTSQLSEMTANYQTIVSEMEAKESELKDVQASLAKMKEEKEEAKATLRKSKLSAVVAEDQVEGIYASLASLEDEAFDTVLAGFAAQSKAVQESELMQEMGSSFSKSDEKEDKEELSTTDKVILERIKQ